MLWLCRILRWGIHRIELISWTLFDGGNGDNGPCQIKRSLKGKNQHIAKIWLTTVDELLGDNITNRKNLVESSTKWCLTVTHQIVPNTESIGWPWGIFTPAAIDQLKRLLSCSYHTICGIIIQVQAQYYQTTKKVG